MHEFPLQVGGDWAKQIEVIRDKCSTDTNLIRFDNTFYRYAGDPGKEDIEISVRTRKGDTAISMVVDTSNIYMYPTKGAFFLNYEVDLSGLVLSDESLDSAIQSMDSKNGGSAADRSLLVFAVAESIRFDQLATDINSCFLADAGVLKTERRKDGSGLQAKGMQIGHWDRIIHKWRNASEAALAGVEASLRREVEARRPLDGSRYQRVQSTGNALLDEALRKLKLIKLPRNKAKR
jgi:hypothetical protein